ncbi:MAG: metal ABC transporter permease [Bacillota bacterium]
MIEKLITYLQYPFVMYAMIVGVLISLCASLVGVALVLRRFSHIGDGLSHVSFGAVAVAAVLNLTNNMPFVLLMTIICAVFLLKTGQNTLIKGDAAIAMLSVGTMAVGYLIMNVFSVSSNLSGDVCTTLFGSTSILTLSATEVNFSIVLSLLVVVIFILFYNKIFAVTFDESFSVAVGTEVQMYNLLIAVVTAVIIVLSMKLVGTLLITALIIFPPVSAMRVFKNFRAVVICSAIIAIICSIIGTSVSIVAGTPVGSTIVVANIVFLGIFALIGKIPLRG